MATTTGPKFGEQEFTSEELIIMRKRLEEKIGSKYISYRKGGGSEPLPYLETNKAIELANDIFGYGGWASQVVNLSVDYIDDVGGKYNAGVSAIVRVQLKDGTHHEDIGYGTADNQKTKSAALNLAKKSAVSDGIKRALRCFGNGLGNSMMDKEHIKHVKTNAPKTPLPSLPPLPAFNPSNYANNNMNAQQNNQQNQQFNNNQQNQQFNNNQQYNQQNQQNQPNQSYNNQQQQQQHNKPQQSFTQSFANKFQNNNTNQQPINSQPQNAPNQQQFQQQNAMPQQNNDNSYVNNGNNFQQQQQQQQNINTAQQQTPMPQQNINTNNQQQTDFSGAYDDFPTDFDV